MSVVIVTGTGTGVGKTIACAALLVAAAQTGRTAAYVKPAQTGVTAAEPADAADVAQISACQTYELHRYRAPLAPASAARQERRATESVDELCARIRRLNRYDLLVVEGAGGLLVHLDHKRGTIADLAAALEAPAVVVATARLGTLNATALTAEALRNRHVELAGVVIGSWPRRPDLTARANLLDLPRYAVAPLLGAVPAGAGRMTSEQFRAAAACWLAPELGGTWQAPEHDMEIR